MSPQTSLSCGCKGGGCSEPLQFGGECPRRLGIPLQKFARRQVDRWFRQADQDRLCSGKNRRPELIQSRFPVALERWRIDASRTRMSAIPRIGTAHTTRFRPFAACFVSATEGMVAWVVSSCAGSLGGGSARAGSAWCWRSRNPPEFRSIRADWQFDANRRVANRRVMVLFQSSAYLAGLNSDDRVISRGVAGRPLEKFCSDRPLFQRFVAALQRMLHHVGQKLLAPIAGTKERAAQDRFQLAKDSLFLGAIRGRPPW